MTWDLCTLVFIANTMESHFFPLSDASLSGSFPFSPTVVGTPDFFEGCIYFFLAIVLFHFPQIIVYQIKIIILLLFLVSVTTVY